MFAILLVFFVAAQLGLIIKLIIDAFYPSKIVCYLSILHGLIALGILGALFCINKRCVLIGLGILVALLELGLALRCLRTPTRFLGHAMAAVSFLLLFVIVMLRIRVRDSLS